MSGRRARREGRDECYCGGGCRDVVGEGGRGEKEKD